MQLALYRLRRTFFSKCALFSEQGCSVAIYPIGGSHIILPEMAPIGHACMSLCLITQSAIMAWMQVQIIHGVDASANKFINSATQKGPQASSTKPCYQGCSANRRTRQENCLIVVLTSCRLGLPPSRFLTLRRILGADKPLSCKWRTLSSLRKFKLFVRLLSETSTISE